MFSPLRTAVTRGLRQTTSSSSAATQLRQYSSQRPPSATGTFYKTFTRPVAKTALLAVFVYQLVYYGWTRLESDEIKADRQAEILRLEAQVRGLHAAREASAKTAVAATPNTKAAA